MLPFNSLTVGLILLVADTPLSSASLVPRAFQGIHNVAIKHTRSLAHDLRVAFGGVLVTQSNSYQTQHVIYCKPGRSPITGNGTTSSPPSGTSQISATGTHTGASSTSTATPSSPWTLVESHEGNDFYDGWSFFTGSDPTNGIVEYVDQATASANGLLEVNSAGNAVMRVETTPSVANTRQSVRITTNSHFNGGLFIMESIHMPTGCGVWPAFWTNGPTWPVTGEIDIVEGVNDYINNQATIHTNPGCTLPSSSSSSLGITGSVVGGTDCAALTTGNQGCGVRANSSQSFGAAFNSNGGGTYAMKWDTSGISIYFFTNGSEPTDLVAGAPTPDAWGSPFAMWPASTCAPFTFFNNHSAIFDTTLCGDWAGSVWSGSGLPGQEQSCSQRTGYSTCQAFVTANGAAFQEAYWEVKSVKIYQLAQ